MYGFENRIKYMHRDIKRLDAKLNFIAISTVFWFMITVIMVIYALYG